MFFLSSLSCFCLKLLELFDEVYDCSFKICALRLSKVILFSDKVCGCGYFSCWLYV